MQQFKVGDWVRTPNRDIFQIKHEIELSGWEITLGGKAELWEPRAGEWCWFAGGCYGIPTVLRFLKRNSDTRYYGYLRDKFDFRVFSHCEPFIGELPSFLKEIK